MPRIQVTTFQIGTPRASRHELRIAATRRPQRGVPRDRLAQVGHFDVWFPNVAPSNELLAHIKKLDLEDEKSRKSFLDRYERELLASAEGRQAVDLLREMARRIPISVGCFCDDEARCHRSRLHEILTRR